LTTSAISIDNINCLHKTITYTKQSSRDMADAAAMLQLNWCRRCIAAAAARSNSLQQLQHHQQLQQQRRRQEQTIASF
jgi:hypothetical protein